jgi:dipeptidase E
MGKIIAIGGGEIGRPNENGGFFPLETLSIDKEIVRQSLSKNPRLLFLGTASDYSDSYFKVVSNYFSKLNCQVNNLNLNNEINQKIIETKILTSDIIYVGGGDIEKLLTTWENFKLKSIFQKAWQKNIILSGVSAGAMCWFEYCDNEEQVKDNNDWDVFQGLNIISSLSIYPHFNSIGKNIIKLQKLSQIKNISFIALDDCVALEIIDDQYRILKSKSTAKAYKIYWKNKHYYQEEVISTKKFNNLKNLLN